MGWLINLASWVIFGALAGWVASIIVGTNQRQGCVMNIIIGVVGALIGGFLVHLLSPGSNFIMDPGFHPINFVVAVVGAVVLLVVLRLVRRSP